MQASPLVVCVTNDGDFLQSCSSWMLLLPIACKQESRAAWLDTKGAGKCLDIGEARNRTLLLILAAVHPDAFHLGGRCSVIVITSLLQLVLFFMEVPCPAGTSNLA